MEVVFGLGNMGKAYNFTRHNFGFLALDFFAKVHGLEWKESSRFSGMAARFGDNLLVKPLTFYNDSGICVRKVVDFYKLDASSDVLVVCDDFNLDFSAVRM